MCILQGGVPPHPLRGGGCTHYARTPGTVLVRGDITALLRLAPMLAVGYSHERARLRGAIPRGTRPNPRTKSPW